MKEQILTQDNRVLIIEFAVALILTVVKTDKGYKTQAIKRHAIEILEILGVKDNDMRDMASICHNIASIYYDIGNKANGADYTLFLREWRRRRRR